MFNFLRKLLTKSFTLGALESPHDPRNVPLDAVQNSGLIPYEYECEDTPIKDQGQRSKCVGSAMTELGELYFKNKGITVRLSDDDLYDQCKAQDGAPNSQGTYPALGAKIFCNTGVASEEVYATRDIKAIVADRENHKLGGYAFVTNNYGAIVQAIYQNGAITASFVVDTNWFIGIIQRVLKSIGRHYLKLTGFRVLDQVLKGQNSWGVGWIGYIAGIFNNKIKPGHFEVRYQDVSDTLIDIIAFVDIPADVLAKYKLMTYSKSFTDSINNVLLSEGGYANNSNDPGGETNFGISKKSYPYLDIKNLTKDQAIAIYYRDFWQPIQGDILPQAIAFNVLDAAINQGAKTAVMMLQSAIGVSPDGAFGPKSKAALASCDIFTTIINFNTIRITKYAGTPGFATFSKWWISRTLYTLIKSQ